MLRVTPTTPPQSNPDLNLPITSWGLSPMPSTKGLGYFIPSTGWEVTLQIHKHGGGRGVCERLQYPQHQWGLALPSSNLTAPHKKPAHPPASSHSF